MDDCWVIQIFFDDDPCFTEFADRVFTTRKSAIWFIEKNLEKFFPFGCDQTIKKVEVNGILRWSLDDERIEVRPYRRH